MKVVDNFELIKGLVNDCAEGEFYMLQIIHRSKDGLTKFDNPNEKSHFSNKTIKTYFVSTPDYLDKKKNEIMELCHIFNARAYISLTKHSWKQVGLKTLASLAQDIANEDYNGVKSIIESSVGQCGSCVKGGATWLVDLDTHDEIELSYVLEAIQKCEPYDVEKIVAVVPTLNGVHIITRPFNKMKFHEYYPSGIDIHKNNPTLLYYKKED